MSDGVMSDSVLEDNGRTDSGQQPQYLSNGGNA
jgi:hypothetical protein